MQIKNRREVSSVRYLADRMYCCNDSSDRIYLEFCNYQCEYSKWFDGEYDHDE